MLIRQTLLYAPAQLLAPLSQLLAVLMWTHIASKESVGAITLVISFQELTQAVCMSWWSQYMIRHRDKYLQSGLARVFEATEIVIVASFLVIQVVIVVILVFLASDEALTISYFAVLVLFASTRSLNNYIAEVYRAGGRILPYTIQQTFGPTLGLIFGFVLMKALYPTAEWALVGYTVGQTIALTWSLYGGGTFPSLSLYSPLILRESLGYGSALLVTNLCNCIVQNYPRYVVQWIYGLAATGLFSVGYGLGQRVSSMAAMLVTAAAFPLAVRAMNAGKRNHAMHQLSVNGILLSFCVAPVSLGMAAVQNDFVNLYVGSEFKDITINILPWALAAGLFRNLRMHYLDQYFLIDNKTIQVLRYASAEAILSLALCATAALNFGYQETIIGVFVASFLCFLVEFFNVRLQYGGDVKLLSFVKIFLAATAMYFLVRYLPPSYSFGSFVFKIALGAVMYFSISALLFWSHTVALAFIVTKNIKIRRS